MPDHRITSPERVTQNHVLDLIEKRLPAYQYVGNLKDTENTNIREDVLSAWLTSPARGDNQLTPEQANSAIHKLK